MTLLLKLALRSLGRSPMRTFLTMSAMAGATALLITALGMIYGMMWDLFASATENYNGHAVVAAPRYLDERHIQLTLEESAPPKRILRDPAVLGRSPRARGFLLLSTGDGPTSQTQPGEVLGVDPATEGTVSRLPRHIVEGRFLKGPANREMVLGKGLARRIEAKLGTDVAVMGQAADGSIAAERFIVVGILESGDKLRDSTLALVQLPDLQETLVLDGQIHEWILKLEDPLHAKAWAAGYAPPPAVPGETPEGRSGPPGAAFEAAPWDRFLPQLSEMLGMIGAIRGIYAFVFYFAVVLVATNTMYMALLERMREFAVMGALGLKPSRLAALVTLEALCLSVVSAIIGGLLGTASTWYLQNHPIDLRGSFGSMSYVGATLQPVYRAECAPEHILFPVVVTALIGVAVALLPAWRLTRLRPVEALREV